MVVLWGFYAKKCSWFVQQRRIKPEDHHHLSLNTPIKKLAGWPRAGGLLCLWGTLYRLLWWRQCHHNQVQAAHSAHFLAKIEADNSDIPFICATFPTRPPNRQRTWPKSTFPNAWTGIWSTSLLRSSQTAPWVSAHVVSPKITQTFNVRCTIYDGTE